MEVKKSSCLYNLAICLCDHIHLLQNVKCFNCDFHNPSERPLVMAEDGFYVSKTNMNLTFVV